MQKNNNPKDRYLCNLNIHAIQLRYKSFFRFVYVFSILSSNQIGEKKKKEFPRIDFFLVSKQSFHRRNFPRIFQIFARDSQRKESTNNDAVE